MWFQTLFAVFAIAFVALLVIHVSKTQTRLYTPHVLSRNFECRWKQRDGFNSVVTIQHDRKQTMQEWYKLISEAKETIVFSTYHWFTHRQRCEYKTVAEVCPQILTIGLALLACQKENGQNPNVKFLLNKALWISRSSIRTEILDALAVWESLGVNLENVNFHVWEQKMIDNIHIKTLIVDSEKVNITSGNVQYGIEYDRSEESPERKLPHKRGENSITVGNDKNFVEEIESFVLEMCNNCVDYSKLRDSDGNHRNILKLSKRYEFTSQTRVLCFEDRPATRILFGNYTAMLTAVAPFTHRNCEVSVLMTHARASLWNSSWSQNNNPLIQTLREATESILIMNPNFSDVSIWEELKGAMNRNVSVTIMTGKYFNERHKWPWRWIAKHLTGFRTNLDMFTTYCEPFVETGKLSWFWYGYDKVASKSSAPRCAHHKLVLVDGHISITGSLNFHVFGLYNSAEIMVRVNSKSVHDEIFNDMVLPMKNRAEKG